MDNKMSTTSGVLVKSIIGIFIAFFIAIPRLASGQYFLESLYSESFFFTLIAITFATVIIGIVWGVLFNLLKKDKGAILNFIIYAITCAFAGLFLANALIAAVGWVSYYGNVDSEMVLNAVLIAAGATFLAVLAAITILPRIEITDRKVKIGQNIGKMLFAILFIQFAVYLLALIFSIFGMPFLFDIYGFLFYGTSIFSIALSIGTSFLALVFFLTILGAAKAMIGNTPKHYEYFIAIMLVNGIIRVYIEIFKLVLKLLARRND